MRPLPRSREAFSPVFSNRPDLRGIHAVFCLSFHPSCRLVASGWQDRWLLRRARLHTKTQKETQFAEWHSSSLCFSGTARAPAAKLLLIVLSVIPPKMVKVSAESFFFPIFFFSDEWAHLSHYSRRSSLTYSALTYFAQRMLRGKQIFPAQCTARLLIQGYCSRAFGGCIVGVFP